MLNSILRFFESSEDQDPTSIRLVRNVLIIAIVATIATITIITTGDIPLAAITVPALVVLTLLEFLALYFVFRNNVLPAKIIVSPALIAAITIVAFSEDSIQDISVIAYPLILIVATLLQGRRAIYLSMPLAVAGIMFLGVTALNGSTEVILNSRTGVDDIIIGAVLIATTSGILNLLVGRLNLAISKAEENEQAEIKANKELIQLQESLEQQVRERTVELESRGTELESALEQIQRRSTQFEALAQVAQSITLIRDIQELLPTIATVVAEKYGFYHVGVFLIDEANEFAVLTATNSEGGRKMLERNHRLKVGEQGIVGSVTGTGIPRIALDVGADAVFFNNPDLPETHSEMALPLQAGDKVIGALDVQSTESGAFTDEDVQTLSLLADQVSLAIENARLFENSNRTLSDLQTLMRQSTQNAWKAFSQKQNLIGYRYNATGAAPLKEAVKLTETEKGKTKAARTESGSYVVPIVLRGEIIGNLVVQSPTGDKWNADQQDIIKAVADRVALSAENARLFEETTQRAERERLVSEITGKIRSHTDPNAMLETAKNELKSALGASRVEIIPQKTGEAGRKDTKV
jgi:GAF domain-containing protein